MPTEGQVVDLRDGRRVVVRPVNSGDGQALAAAFLRLSADSQQLRFGSAPRTLGSAALRHLVDSVDGVDHVAYAAFAQDHTGHLVGVGRILRYHDDPESLDVGMTVADDYQGNGLGRVIAGLLAEHRPTPARRIVTQIAHDNRRAFSLLSAFGSPRRTPEGQIVVDFENAKPQESAELR